MWSFMKFKVVSTSQLQLLKSMSWHSWLRKFLEILRIHTNVWPAASIMTLAAFCFITTNKKQNERIHSRSLLYYHPLWPGHHFDTTCPWTPATTHARDVFLWPCRLSFLHRMEVKKSTSRHETWGSKFSPAFSAAKIRSRCTTNLARMFKWALLRPGKRYVKQCVISQFVRFQSLSKRSRFPPLCSPQWNKSVHRNS